MSMRSPGGGSGNASFTGGTLDGIQRVGFAQTAGGASNATLFWDAANVIGQRNGTNPQTFRVYNTYATAGTDYERLQLEWIANVAYLYVSNGGTGQSRSLRFGVASSAQWEINGTTGAFQAIAAGANALATGFVTAASGTAPAAGGSAGLGLLMSSVASFGFFFGTGNPTISAAQGSLYLNRTGSGIADRLWVNTNGTTGWTNFVTAA